MTGFENPFRFSKVVFGKNLCILADWHTAEILERFLIFCENLFWFLLMALWESLQEWILGFSSSLWPKNKKATKNCSKYFKMFHIHVLSSIGLSYSGLHHALVPGTSTTCLFFFFFFTVRLFFFDTMVACNKIRALFCITRFI